MPRLPVHTPQTAPAPNDATLEQLRRRYGRVLNIHGAMAHSPAVLQTYSAMEEALKNHSTFDARTREALALAVANENGCTYCEAAHTASGAQAGLTREEMLAIRAGREHEDGRLVALAAVAREYARNSGYVEERTWRVALDVGWSEAELAEVAAHATLDIFTNYFNHLNGTEGDYRPAPDLGPGRS